MNTKICTKCKTEYPATVEFFFVGKSCADGLRGKCKKCFSAENRVRRKRRGLSPNTNVNIKKCCSVCGKEYPATIKYFFKGYGMHDVIAKCKKCFTAEGSVRKQTEAYKIKSRESGKKHYAKNKKKYAERWAIYYSENAESLKKKSRQYAHSHREQLRKHDRKRRSDPKYRLSSGVSRSIRQHIHEGSKNNRHWENLVGYTLNDLVSHLEKQFQPGMTWGNYGEWHIDHVTPVSVFNFTKPEHPDFKRCWSLENLQPLWAHENLTKHAKLEKPFQPMLALG